MTPDQIRISELEEEVRQLRAMLKPDFCLPAIVKLTACERDIVSVIYARPDNLVSRNKLLMLVWPDREVSEKNVDVLVGRARDKMKRYDVAIVNVRGRG